MVTENIRYYQTKPLYIEIVTSIGSTHSYAMHNHVSMFIIGVISSGKVRVKIGAKSFCLGKGKTFIVRPYEPHSIVLVEPYDMLCLCINKRLVENSSMPDLRTSVLSVLNDELVTKQQKELIMSLISSTKKLPQWNPEKLEPEIQLLKNNIELHPENNISLEEMSRKVFFSKYYFIKRFKRKLGLTPHQFQIQNRVRKAQRIIDMTPTLTEVALITGFCDQSHFIKQFTRIVGLTPTCYKKSCSHISFSTM